MTLTSSAAGYASDIPRSCIAFYHTQIGMQPKREIEEQLRSCETRIVSCTDTVEISCSMLHGEY
ncbi:hypothetical protein EDB19DRAFT_1709356, partial [Suillus lakei]